MNADRRQHHLATESDTGASRWDTIILSDIHLGVGSCKAQHLLEMLSCVVPGVTRNIYLDGDIIDGWDFKKFSEAQKRVIDRLLDLSCQGVNIVYTPGNHDELLRELLPVPRDGGRDNMDPHAWKRLDDFDDDRALSVIFNDCTLFELRRGFIFEAADNRRYAFQHGDQFDDWMRNDTYIINLKIPGLSTPIQFAERRRTSEIVSTSYEMLIDGFSGIFVAPHDTHFPAQKWLKSLGKHASGAVKKLRKGACGASLGAGLDGVICGHIHEPDNRDYYASPDGAHLKTKKHKVGDDWKKLTYLNAGDWKETCSFLVFDQDGAPGIVHWQQARKDFGFDGKPKLAKTNPSAHMRTLTNQICRAVRDILACDNPVDYIRSHGQALERRADNNADNSATTPLNNAHNHDGAHLEMRLKHRAGNCIRQGIDLNMPV